MKIDNFTYLLLKAIRSGKIYPVNKFMNLEETTMVIKKFKFKNKLFPLPILLGSTTLPKNKNINIYFNKKKISNVKIESIFKLNLKEIFFDILGTKYKVHPLYKYYKKYNYFLSTKPMKIKKKSIKRNKSLVTIATRNKPHIGHQTIIKYLLTKYKNITVTITQKNINKSSFSSIKDGYVKFLTKEKLNNRVNINNFTFPSFKLGPREGLLQAITRKNLYNADFVVGRDHSGYKSFFNENDTYKLCKKYENKIGVKIIYPQSPFFCIKCDKINLRTDCLHWKNKKFFIDISNTNLKNIKKYFN